MIGELSSVLASIEDILWVYFCFPVLIVLGMILTVRGRFAQIRQLPQALRHFVSALRQSHSSEGKVQPVQAFFACIGGCIGIGNIIAVCAAVQIGGPGALVWLWLTALIGAIIKYSEVYLGLRYRISDGQGGYRGGPMYFLEKVFKGSWAPVLVSILLCFYGVEVYQFSVVASSISTNFGWAREAVIAGLLALVMYAGMGGVSRVGKISGTFIPFFILVYLGMCLWVVANNITLLPGILSTTFVSAFSGHAAAGGFVGSTMMMAITHGLRRACYSGDLGIGYASVIHSQSSEVLSEKQASLVIVDIFLDTIICTATLLLILVTGQWQNGLPQELLVQEALSSVFPYIHYFMPIFLFLLGYSTINAYFIVGLTCSEFLGGSLGRKCYFLYACFVLILFAYVDTSLAQTAMTIMGGMLLVLNCYGIYRLRHEINFNFAEQKATPILVGAKSLDS